MDRLQEIFLSNTSGLIFLFLCLVLLIVCGILYLKMIRYKNVAKRINPDYFKQFGKYLNDDIGELSRDNLLKDIKYNQHIVYKVDENNTQELTKPNLFIQFFETDILELSAEEIRGMFDNLFVLLRKAGAEKLKLSFNKGKFKDLEIDADFYGMVSKDIYFEKQLIYSDKNGKTFFHRDK